MTPVGKQGIDTQSRGAMSALLGRLGRYRKQIANRLLAHKLLLTLRSAGIVIEPYIFYQEGPFRPPPAADVSEFSFRELGEVDHAGLAPFYPRPPDREELRARFAGGQHCFALVHDGRIAAFSWCETARIGFRPCSRPLGKREAYLFGAETLYEYRGRKIQPYLRYQCYEALRARGRDLVYSYCDFFNHPARRFKAALGARALLTGLNLGISGIGQWNIVLKKHGDPAEPVWPAGNTQ